MGHCKLNYLAIVWLAGSIAEVNKNKRQLETHPESEHGAIVVLRQLLQPSSPPR